VTLDYYSPHPRAQLTRPLALVGGPGSGVRAVARAICAVTGLPLNDVERLAEARAGRSRARLWVEDGAGALRALETEVTFQAIARRPKGVIALSDSALLDAAVRERCTQTTLVYLERPPAFLLEMIGRAPPAAFPAFLAGAPRSVEELLPYLEEREPHYLRADVRFRGERLHPNRIADELIAALGILPPGEAPERAE
jgi:shikimate kinase